MSETNTGTHRLRAELVKLQRGDAEAADRLIEHAYQQLQRMAKKMLQSYPGVKRWEETDDVWLATAISFHRALTETPPVSTAHFYNLAGMQIRWTLIDMVRKYNGPQGLNSNHDTNLPDERSGNGRWSVEPGEDPVSLVEWEEFHRDIESLPDDSRELFNLLWYGGLSQAEAAKVLGLHYRSVKRRWRKARLMLYNRRAGDSLSM